MSEEPRVAEVLQQLRAGVRQRQAELATIGAATDEARFKLVELTAKEYIQEPICVSPRPVVGRWIVFARKAFFHLLMKWYLRPVLEQQNAFNQTASRLVQDLVQSQEKLARQLRELEARLAAVEKRVRENSPEDTV
jgi:hypothetical protein